MSEGAGDFPKKEQDIIFDAVPAMIFIKDKENRFLRVNEALAKIMGTTKANLEGKSIFDLYPREEAEKFWQDDKAIIASGKPRRNIVEEMNTPEGAKWVRTDKLPLRDEAGNIIGILGFSVDITELKIAEYKLDESEAGFRVLYESSSDAIMMLTPKAGFFSGNPAAIKLFGCRDKKEFTMKSPADLSPEYQPDGALSSTKAQQMMSIAMEKGSHYFEWVHKRVDGSEFYATVLLARFEIGAKEFLQATVRDITELKKTEQALRESEERYRSLVENVDVGIYRNTAGEKGSFISANPAIAKIFGYESVKEFLKVNVSDLYQDPQERKLFLEEIIQKGSVDGKELKLRKKDGTSIVCAITAQIKYDDKRNIEWIDGVVQDITERKLYEEKIRKAAEEWSRTFDAISDMIFIMDKDHNFKRANKAACEALKMREEELIGRKCYEILHKRNDPWPLCPMEQTNQDHMSHIEEVDDPVIGVIILVSTSPIFDEKGQYVGVVHVAKDISQRKKIEDELIRRIDSLERFQRITVDRELKMKELKEKIKELEGLLAKNNNK
ncbi:MAG: PAS domain S-box protein [Candidatus Omnitrophica bacterium]|nr:PAS domain S-box protein [Candidatus Omnitrophota bacterium]